MLRMELRMAGMPIGSGSAFWVSKFGASASGPSRKHDDFLFIVDVRRR
jgi:hypothetical protein